MTLYARIGVFQLTRFKLGPSHDLESTLNTPIFTLAIWVLILTFFNFFINLELRIYNVLSLLTCFFVTKVFLDSFPKANHNFDFVYLHIL